MQITYRIKELERGGYMAYCPAMKPVIVYGKTEEEASEKLLGAAKLYMQAHPDFAQSLKSSVLEV